MGQSTVSRSRAVAVLKLPEDHVPHLLVRARGIVTAMTGNSWFSSPSPSLATVSAAIDALDQAETAARSKTVGTTAIRDAKRRELQMVLEQLRAYVQAIADANPESAASIIESAAMFVKGKGGRTPQVFEVNPGPVSGSVKVLLPRARDRDGYEVAQSTDGGRTWVSLDYRTRASLVVTGLKPGSRVYFRYRVVTPDGPGDWSDPISIIVD
jgi:hypothetical protein